MIRLLPWVATVVVRSLRIKIKGKIPEKAVIIFWHGKMFAGWYAAAKRTGEFSKRTEDLSKPVALVSLSNDGNILSNVLRHWGYKVERGSSSRSGLEALERAVARVRTGQCNRIVITPDGPRGPRHRLKRGAFLAAKELGLPVYFLRIKYSRAKTLGKSWDRFEIPLPLSGVEIIAEQIPLSGYPESIEQQHQWLNRLTDTRGL